MVILVWGVPGGELVIDVIMAFGFGCSCGRGIGDSGVPGSGSSVFIDVS